MSEPKYLGNHVWFVAESAGVSTAAIKPATGSFAKAGIIKSLRMMPQVESRDIYSPDPGQLTLQEKLAVKKTLKFQFTLGEVGPLFWQLVFGSLALTAGSAVQYNPMEGIGAVRGWVKIQQYDQANVLYNTVDLWSYLEVSGQADFTDSEATVDVDGTVMRSTLNTGVFATLA